MTGRLGAARRRASRAQDISEARPPGLPCFGARCKKNRPCSMIWVRTQRRAIGLAMVLKYVGYKRVALVWTRELGSTGVGGPRPKRSKGLRRTRRRRLWTPGGLADGPTPRAPAVCESVANCSAYGQLGQADHVAFIGALLQPHIFANCVKKATPPTPAAAVASCTAQC